MVDTVIQLGDFTFQDFEIPEKINFGGSQQLVQHDLIGGGRVIDALGKNDLDITWSGLFTGPQAITRAQQLNTMRANGNQIKLTWFNFNYDVVIQNFEAQTERFYQVTYTITLRVLLDGANPNSALNLIGFNEAINNDLKTANTLTDNIDEPTITSAVANVNTAVAAVPTFNGASPATIAPVTSSLDIAISAVKSFISDIEDTFSTLFNTT